MVDGRRITKGTKLLQAVGNECSRVSHARRSLVSTLIRGGCLCLLDSLPKTSLFTKIIRPVSWSWQNSIRKYPNPHPSPCSYGYPIVHCALASTGSLDPWVSGTWLSCYLVFWFASKANDRWCLESLSLRADPLRHHFAELPADMLHWIACLVCLRDLVGCTFYSWSLTLSHQFNSLLSCMFRLWSMKIWSTLAFLFSPSSSHRIISWK